MLSYDNYKIRVKRFVDDNIDLIYRDRNIIGMGIGNKIINGFMTNIPTITFIVIKKYEKGSIPKRFLIPNYVRGIRTDIFEVGEIKSYKNMKVKREDVNSYGSETEDFYKNRPAFGGMNIGPASMRRIGTLGCVVTDKGSKKRLYALTSNHVLTADGVGKQGELVLQPCHPYGGREPNDVLGVLDRTIAVKRGIPQNPKDINEVDAALVYVGLNTKEVKDKILYPKIRSPYLSEGVVTPMSTTKVEVGDAVSKMGAVSARSTGKVICIGANVAYEEGEKEELTAFKNQIFVDFKSIRGDSGALGYTEKDKKAFGLLMGGNGAITFMNDIDRVFDLLKIELAKY